MFIKLLLMNYKFESKYQKVKDYYVRENKRKILIALLNKENLFCSNITLNDSLIFI